MGSNLLPAAELDSLNKRDPLAFGISHVDLLDGKKWEIGSRKWIVEPYNMVNPYRIEKNSFGEPRKVCFTKSTQAGITTMALVKALHFLSYWEVRVMMMEPRQKDCQDFSNTRLDPVIENSPFLKAKLGKPNSVYTKRIGKSYLFLLEGSVEPRSMPADALLLDEVDLCSPEHVGTAINRLDASTWQILMYLSTPTLPNFGIDAVYNDSDQREWLVPCPQCGEKQPLDWEKTLRISGPPDNPDKVFYGCVKCHRELTLEDIQQGQWVARRPERSSELVGYHISQMMTSPASVMYKHFRDPNQTMAEFYRKRLGRPYTYAGGSLERTDFLENCFDEPYEPETHHDGSSTYYMGVDQGNQLQLVVGKIERDSRRLRIVHIEIVPFEEGFDRVAKLIKAFRVKRAVVDGDPNRHSVKALQSAFPSRVLMADYVEQKQVHALRYGDKKIPEGILIDRTMAFDGLVEAIKDGMFALPGSAASPLQEVEILMDQASAIRRDIERRKRGSTEVEVGVWRSIRADHLAHAMVYLQAAAEATGKRSFKAAVAKARPEQESEPEEVPEQKLPPSDMRDKEAADIVAILAEVPEQQIIDFVKGVLNKEDNPIPFPLSVKLQRAVEKHKKEHVFWVIINIMVKGKIKQGIDSFVEKDI